ncbi:MAG: hypothetical protein KAS32_11055 [Candidatus Peribacteraceae bacterium]|nr:hypothetical protein [Candidatus Peribacteraceae bacterium]
MKLVACLELNQELVSNNNGYLFRRSNNAYLVIPSITSVAYGEREHKSIEDPVPNKATCEFRELIIKTNGDDVSILYFSKDTDARQALINILAAIESYWISITDSIEYKGEILNQVNNKGACI